MKGQLKQQQRCCENVVGKRWSSLRLLLVLEVYLWRRNRVVINYYRKLWVVMVCWDVLFNVYMNLGKGALKLMSEIEFLYTE